MQKDRIYRVYWVYVDGMIDYRTQGYVGVTKENVQHRLLEHFRSNRPVGSIIRDLRNNNEIVKVVELFRGSKEEALAKEYEYRPARFIGWNIMAGGNRATIVCVKCGKTIPKGYTNVNKLCSDCNDYDGRFVVGSKPANYGKGEKYLLISPDGVEHTPEAFTVFCKHNDLTPQNLRKVAKGTRKHHKGWKAIKLS